MNRKYPLFCIVLAIFFFFISFSPVIAANKIMPLGDSLTRGIVGSTDDSGYRRTLYLDLVAAGIPVDFVGSLQDGTSLDFDRDHEGHGGWHANEIVDGRLIEPDAGDLAQWLTDQHPDIVLLHIGTNDISANDEDWHEVEAILQVIDDYEFNTGQPVWVILTRIIKRGCSPYVEPCANSVQTTNFNDDVEQFVFDPRQTGGDRIVLVDMENGAGINYRWQSDNPLGDMWDDVHPIDSGYDKMADQWFAGLMQILPQAVAGPDQDANESDTVTLNGSGSADPKGGDLSYQWVQTAGTSVTLSDDQAAQPDFVVPSVASTGETLTFKLTVTDEDGLVAEDTVSIFVLIPPVADAGADQSVKEGVTVNLDGSGSSDSDGTIATYAWTQIGTPSVTLTGADTATPSFTAPTVAANTTLTFQLEVTDNDGQSDTDTVQITVANKIAPVADAGADQTVNEGVTVNLDGSGSSDADGSIAAYAWTQTAGTPVTLTGADTATPSFSAPAVTADTTLTFQLTVTDDDGQPDTDTVQVTIVNNIAPVADAGADQTVNEGVTVNLDGSGSSDADGSIAAYAWTQTAGTPVTLSGANTATPSFTAPAVAADTTLTFQLTVTDNDALASSPDTVSIVIHQCRFSRGQPHRRCRKQPDRVGRHCGDPGRLRIQRCGWYDRRLCLDPDRRHPGDLKRGRHGHPFFHRTDGGCRHNPDVSVEGHRQ